MIVNLERYYEENGILSSGFTCKHREDCSKNSDAFTGPKSAMISRGYEQGNLPRLLFLSLDSGSGEVAESDRLPLSVRSIEANRDVQGLPRHKHWYRTHELAWIILRRFLPDLKFEDAKNHFAHANSAKCCMNKAQRRKADSVLFRNCREYLKEEFRILDPDIVVTQGDEAKRAFLELSTATGVDYGEFSSVRQFGDKKIFWLKTFHPNCWGKFNAHRRGGSGDAKLPMGWEVEADRIELFINNRSKSG